MCGLSNIRSVSQSRHRSNIGENVMSQCEIQGLRAFATSNTSLALSLDVHLAVSVRPGRTSLFTVPYQSAFRSPPHFEPS